ncbi:MAG: hypothetical protein KatS3mg020_0830 [Fimbriimonadales bacterium]|nr:MAG: hypothetical protein KatS3mg019_0375 [Fimbriimonadales bacterium]GIV11339.1 MAG: hypothetical protein KatS3mg020_0830 [Fimbriimonadales bacterium]
MQREIEQSLALTYKRLTYASAFLMAIGWAWHIVREDRGNWLIDTGLGLLLLTPLLALAHLAWLAKERDRLTSRYSGIALALLALAVLMGLIMQGLR